MYYDIWKYCTKEQWTEFLLSLNITGRLRLSDEQKLSLLYGLSNHTEEHYTSVRIPKSSGGFRVIRKPDSLLKYIQRQILSRILVQFPVSGCARAYLRGVPLTANALPHTGKEKILKLDIDDFFGNITYISVYQHAFPGTLFPPAVRTLLTGLCCYDSILPQGAPTSPYISNLVMVPFDETMDQWCRKRGITYTRYCDDMTFSGSFNTGEVISKTRFWLRRLGFELNDRKTRVITQSGRQEVTGLTVNQKAQTPKFFRRSLRQEWYYIRKYGAADHLRRRLHTENITEEESRSYLLRLAGKIAYVLQANPENPEFRAMQSELQAMLRAPGTDVSGSS